MEQRKNESGSSTKRKTCAFIHDSGNSQGPLDPLPLHWASRGRFASGNLKKRKEKKRKEKKRKGVVERNNEREQ
jgi:hypothetical protein